VLTADHALLVQAVHACKENSTGITMNRTAGEKWLITGPKEYWPPLEVKMIRNITAFLRLGSVNLFKPDAFVLYIIGVLFVLYILWCLVSIVL